MSWPIDPWIYTLREYIHKTPLCDFPENNPLEDSVFPDDVVLEAGTNIGGLTYFLGHIAKEVHTFEPNPYALIFAKRRVGHMRNVHFYNMAISDHVGKAPFNFSWSFSGANSLYKIQNAGGAIQYTKQFYVETINIDNFVKLYGVIPTVLVLDCEGSELKALQGAEALLPSIDRIFCETHPVERDGQIILTRFEVGNFLTSHGYQITTGRDRGKVLWLIGKKGPNRSLSSSS